MANANELMDFVKSLNDRGLLSKPIEQFDYEWVIWDYERSKVKNLPFTPMLADSDLKGCKNCKFHNAEKISCSHYYWQTCIVRDGDGYVSQYQHHQFR